MSEFDLLVRYKIYGAISLDYVREILSIRYEIEKYYK